LEATIKKTIGGFLIATGAGVPAMGVTGRSAGSWWRPELRRGSARSSILEQRSDRRSRERGLGPLPRSATQPVS